MKNYKFIPFLVFSCLVGLSFVCLDVQAEDLSEYYPLQEGNLWIYQRSAGGDEKGKSEPDEKLRVAAKEWVNNMEIIKLVDLDGNYEYLAIEQDGIKLYKDADHEGYQLYQPPLLFFPLGTEKTERREKYLYREFDNQGNPTDGGEVTLEIKVEGSEDVNVAAGQFPNCLKLYWEKLWVSQDGSFAKTKITNWFAKGVGRVKQTMEEIGYDLEEGSTYTEFEKYLLKEAIIDGVRYGKEE